MIKGYYTMILRMINMDAFDRAFQKCSKDEQETILKMTPQEFSKALLQSFKVRDTDGD